MNYFELYEIPVSFQVDQGLLKKKYYELSRLYHPDFFTSSPGEEQAGILEKASQVNKAYKVLQSLDETIKYVLQLMGLLQEEEKFELDPQFLMEVMDINEELMELEMDENQEQLMNVEQKANRLMLKIYEDAAPVMDAYQEGVTTEEELLQVKDFYFQQKYLQRILDKIRGIRNIASPL